MRLGELEWPAMVNANSNDNNDNDNNTGRKPAQLNWLTPGWTLF